MLFQKRNRRDIPPPEVRQSIEATSQTPSELVHIDFDMMLKGSVVQRGKTRIKQYGVTVNGAPRIVTSGDTVDRKTFEALVAAGAVAAPESQNTIDDASPHNSDNKE